MDVQQSEMYKSNARSLCRKLLNELKANKEDTEMFFGGEVYKTYVEATDMAISKAKSIRAKLNNI